MPDYYASPGETDMSSSSASDDILTEQQESDINKVVNTFKESWRKAPKKWGIDKLPYSPHFEQMVRQIISENTPDNFRVVAREAYRLILSLRKRGELAGRGPRPDLAPKPWKNTEDRVPLSKALKKTPSKKKVRKA